LEVDEDDMHDATSQEASDWMVSDNGDNGNGNTSDEDNDELAVPNLGLGDSRHTLDVALDDICHSHVPADLGLLTPTDQALNVWDNQERLQQACATLSIISKNTNFDVIL